MTRNEIWNHLHADNHRAHSEGRTAARTGKNAIANPYTGDAAYWWNEGYHGRSFETLTSVTDLDRIAQEIEGAA